MTIVGSTAKIWFIEHEGFIDGFIEFIDRFIEFVGRFIEFINQFSANVHVSSFVFMLEVHVSLNNKNTMPVTEHNAIWVSTRIVSR